MRSVYAAQAMFTDGRPTGLVKIGCSFVPRQRVATIGTVVPFEFELIGAFSGGFFSEAAAHLLLRQWRSKGEYFWDSPALRVELQKMMDRDRPHRLIKDDEITHEIGHIDLGGTADRLGLDTLVVANRLGIDGGYLRRRFKAGAGTSRCIAAGIAIAAAEMGIRTRWPVDFRRSEAA